MTTIHAAYRRLAAAIVLSAATDFAQSDDPVVVVDTVIFLLGDWFRFLAAHLDIEPREFITHLKQRRKEFEGVDMDRRDFRMWLRGR